MDEEIIRRDNSFLDKTRLVNRNALKYIVIVLMFFDHLVQVLFQTGIIANYSPFYIIARTLARLTGPIMFYFLAEGFDYTRDVKKYLLRLGIFALVSHIPFVFFESHQWSPIGIFDGNVEVSAATFFYMSWADKTFVIYNTSVIYTLFLGLLTLIIWKKSKIHISLKIFLQFLFCTYLPLEIGTILVF